MALSSISVKIIIRDYKKCIIIINATYIPAVKYNNSAIQ